MKNKNKGILCILSAAFFFALMSAFIRLAGDVPSIQKSFFRNLVALMFAFIVLIRSGDKFKFNKTNLPFLIIRSICGTIGILGNFYAVDHLLLADASMLNKLSPFFAIIFSLIFLKEKASALQWCSIVIAFLGSLLIIKPSFSNPDLIPSLIGVVGAMGAGLAYTAVRYLGMRKERGPFIVFFFSTFSCLVVLPYVVMNYHPMTLAQLGCLLLAGLAAAGGQFSVTTAYTYAPAKELSVYDYSQIVFSALFGWAFFGQIPDQYSVLGYLIIFGVSLFMFIRNNKKI